MLETQSTLQHSAEFYERLISKRNAFKNELITHVSYKALCILITNLERIARTVSVFSPFAYPASEKMV